MEQMLLCTLLPFEQLEIPDFKALQEVSVTVHWRYHELRFASPTETYTMPINATNNAKWIHLLSMPYCRLAGLMSVAPGMSGTSFMGPSAIRLYINKDAFGLKDRLSAKLCEPNVMAFETMLRDVLSEVPYVLESEPVARKRKVPWDLGPKTLEASPTVALSNQGLYWNFLERAFTQDRVPNETMTLRPTVLASDACEGWTKTLLTSVDAVLPRRKAGPLGSTTGLYLGLPHATLVLTSEPSLWTDTASWDLSMNFAELGPLGLKAESLQTAQVIVTTPEHFASNIVHSENVLDAVEMAMSCVMNQACSRQQVKRTLLDNLVAKLPNFVLPANYIQFGAIIVDDIEKHESVLGLLRPSMASRWLQVVRTGNLKPTSLSLRAARVAFSTGLGTIETKGPAWVRAAACGHMDSLIHVIGVPKNVLKRIKIVPHALKNGQVEERVAKAFGSKYCPLPPGDAIQRFAGTPVPIDIAEDLIQRHFQRLDISLGAFLQRAHIDDTSTLSLGFLRTSLRVPQKACAICFDDMDGPFYITMCGHLYCADCTNRHFSGEWSIHRPKACAACRTPLLLGDMFHVNNDVPFRPALTSRAEAVQNFCNSFKRPEHVKVFASDWSYEEYPQTKDLVVTNMMLTTPAELLRRTRSCTGQLKVHVFFMPDEGKQFQDFASSFA